MSNAIDITCHEKRPSVPEELQFKVEKEVLGYLEHMTARFFKRVVNTNLSSQQECFKKSWTLITITIFLAGNGFPADNHLSKIKNSSIILKFQVCLKLTIKTPQRLQIKVGTHFVQ